jgi:hypothetical protein
MTAKLRSIGAASSIQAPIATPTGLVNGDQLYAFASADYGDGDWTAPSGWTKIAYEVIGSPDGQRLAVFKKDAVVAGGEASSYSFPSDNGTTGLGSIFAVYGGDGTETIAVYSSSSDNATPFLISVAGFAVPTDGFLAFGVAADPRSAGARIRFNSWNYSLTEQFYAEEDWSQISLATRDECPSGATGSLEVTVEGDSGGWLAFAMLVPAAEGGGGGHNLDAGLATETDSALAIGKAKFKALGIALETDSVLGLVFNRRRQHSFRWFNDDGSEAAATPAAALNTATTITPGTAQRLRFLIDFEGNMDRTGYKLQYRKVGATPWKDVQL